MITCQLKGLLKNQYMYCNLRGRYRDNSVCPWPITAEPLLITEGCNEAKSCSWLQTIWNKIKRIYAVFACQTHTSKYELISYTCGL